LAQDGEGGGGAIDHGGAFGATDAAIDDEVDPSVELFMDELGVGEVFRLLIVAGGVVDGHGEEGVTVSFGTEQGGQNLTWQETNVPPVQNYVPEPVREVEEKPLTQDFEDAPEVRTPERPKTPKKEESKPKKENPKPVVPQFAPQQPQQTVVKEPEPPQPQVNQQALFPGRTPETQQGGAGTGGQAGNQGMPDGQATTPSLGQGSGAGTGSGHGQGTGGGGIGYSVGNRKALKLPPPEYPGQKNGKVVVKVWVNKEGKVVKAVIVRSRQGIRRKDGDNQHS